MSNSVLPGEEASWAQTFITVTPHEDGFLREIEENVVVSGSGDTPFHLDTWNIVLRRSLVNTAKDWIDSSELEESKRVESECQTYLQGVPKVDLPLVYRDEATQTLYMGRDGIGIWTPMEYFDDIITVLNEKSMPEQKTSRVTQTIITMKDIASKDDAITMLIADSDAIANDSQSSIDEADKECAFMEASDIMHFVVERSLWILRSQSGARKEKEDASVQTALMYNHKTKKVTIDYEVQTELTCEPKYSNSMLLADYNETKHFCRDRVNQCIENGIYPRIEIDNIVEEIITKCKRHMNFSSEEKIAITAEKSASNVENVASTEKNDQYDVKKVTSIVEKTANDKFTGGSKMKICQCGITSEINKVTRPIRNALFTENQPRHRHSSWKSMTTPRCNITSWRSGSTSSGSTQPSSGSSQPSSSSSRSLLTEDVQALAVLKNAFCSRDTAAKR